MFEVRFQMNIISTGEIRIIIYFLGIKFDSKYVKKFKQLYVIES